jgi:hypothetical protein
MRRFKHSFGIPSGAQCGDRIGTKRRLFMRGIYDLDLAREIAAGEGTGALVVDDGPHSWAVVVLDKPSRLPLRVPAGASNVMRPARISKSAKVTVPAHASISAKQTKLF